VRFSYFTEGLRKSTKTQVKTAGETTKSPVRQLVSIILVRYHYSVLLTPRNLVLREKPIVPQLYKCTPSMESRDSSPCSPLACSYPEPHKSCSLTFTIFTHATFYYQYALYSYSCQVAPSFQVFQLKSCCTFYSFYWACYVPNPSHSTSFDHSL
jgi:hypothetical protein